MGSFGTIAAWKEPSAVDASGNATLLIKTHSPGELFPVGNTSVSYVFVDSAFNMARCYFEVFVITGNFYNLPDCLCNYHLFIFIFQSCIEIPHHFKWPIRKFIHLFLEYADLKLFQNLADYILSFTTVIKECFLFKPNLSYITLISCCFCWFIFVYMYIPVCSPMVHCRSEYVIELKRIEIFIYFIPHTKLA